TVGTTVQAVECANRCLKDTGLPYQEGAKPEPDWKLDSLELRQFFHLLALKPDSDQEEMCQYIWDQFHVLVPISWVSRHLNLAKWSKHTLKQVAKEREQVI